MIPVLRVKDSNGNIINIPAIRGEDGKSAYQSAKDGGYIGTEEEFNAALNNMLPSVTADDNGKFLMVSEGAWAAVAVPSAEEAVF